MSELVKSFGEDHAQAVWDAQLAAIDTIDRIVWREQIKCQFDWVPGYLFNPSAATCRPDHERQRRSTSRRKPTLAGELGFDAEFVDVRSVHQQPGVRFENQAKFHPRKYLIALLRLLSTGKGCQVYEQTEIERDRGHADHRDHAGRPSHSLRASCSSRRTCRCRARSGLLPATFLQSKLAPYTSYVVGGWVPRGTVPEALFWDTGDPYDYLRVDRRHDHDFVIFGGEDHKTGQVEDTTAVLQHDSSSG